MNDVTNYKVPKWPFFLADALLMFFAYYYVLHAALPIHHWEIAAGCVTLGALLGVLPYYLDYRATGKALEADALGAVAGKFQDVKMLVAQIGSASSQWAIIQEAVQTESGKTAAIAKDIAEKMTEEVRRFSEFMQKMNDNEKSTLRLEVEKLRRSEGEWLQMLVRILDHVFALHTGAVRTGDQRFIEPITNFQNACRDTVRRLGLTPFVAEPDELFDAERHQLAGKPEKVPNGAVVSETIGAGYTFQGKLLRPAIVRLHEAKVPAAKPAQEENAADELPL
ncbi:MAG: nucleotide exchange factor GrpE [Verrucomicrobiales bacterium]|nr:nucleotide exchange factor GrpE [Verrucomicrobiales bacterium]